MKYNVKYTDDASIDIERVYNEVFEACLDIKTTKDYLAGLLDKIKSIFDFPESGIPLYVGKIQSEYRYVIYKSYMAFYRLHNGTIFIDRVLYGKSDYLVTLGIK